MASYEWRQERDALIRKYHENFRVGLRRMTDIHETRIVPLDYAAIPAPASQP